MKSYLIKGTAESVEYIDGEGFAIKHFIENILGNDILEAISIFKCNEVVPTLRNYGLTQYYFTDNCKILNIVEIENIEETEHSYIVNKLHKVILFNDKTNYKHLVDNYISDLDKYQFLYVDSPTIYSFKDFESNVLADNDIFLKFCENCKKIISVSKEDYLEDDDNFCDYDCRIENKGKLDDFS